MGHRKLAALADGRPRNALPADCTRLVRTPPPGCRVDAGGEFAGRPARALLATLLPLANTGHRAGRGHGTSRLPWCGDWCFEGARSSDAANRVEAHQRLGRWPVLDNLHWGDPDDTDSKLPPGSAARSHGSLQGRRAVGRAAALGKDLARRSSIWPDPHLYIWGWQSPLHFYGKLDGVSRHFFVDNLLRDQAERGHPLIQPRIAEIMTALQSRPPALIFVGYSPFTALCAFLQDRYLPSGLGTGAERTRSLGGTRPFQSVRAVPGDPARPGFRAAPGPRPGISYGRRWRAGSDREDRP